MKNLLFITVNDHVPWGGSEVLWYKTSLQLKDTVNVKALVKKWPKNPKSIEELNKSGVEVLYKQVHSISFLDRIKKKLFGIGVKRKHDLEQEGIGTPDLVVISIGNHLDWALFYYTDFLNRKNIPFVILYQLVTDLRGLKDDMVSRFRQTLLKAKKIYVLSEDNKLKLQLQFAHNFKTIEKVNNPFDYQAKGLAMNKSKTDAFFLGLVGAYNSLHKGHDILLKVLSTPKWKNRNWVLNLYGAGHNEFQIRGLVEMYGLKDKVVFNGFIENKEDIWRLNHALIMPSRMEGQSLAMLEAMSHGRMVISTNVGAAKELIEDAITGFLAKGPTVELVDEALERAWQVRDQWLEIGKLSRKKLYEVIPQDPVLSFSNKLKELIR